MGKRLIQQRRGKGGIYRSPSHNFVTELKYPSDDFKGEVVDMVHDPGRTGVLAKIKLENENIWFLSCEGMKVGQKVTSSDESDVNLGNVMNVGRIPEGIPVYNIELHRGDGGKIVRTAGSSAIVVSHGKETSVLQLPSGRFKEIRNNCRGTIGVVAGGGRGDKPFVKAGNKYHNAKAKGRKYPKVRGVAMNPVSHPHGGGNHQRIGKPSTVSRNAPPGRKVGHLSPKKRNKKE